MGDGGDDFYAQELEGLTVIEQASGRVFGRGLHSSTFRLNVSAFRGIGGAFRGY